MSVSLRHLLVTAICLAFPIPAEVDAQTLRVQWDGHADFTKYHSFAWTPGRRVPDDSNHELLVQSIRDALGVAAIFEDDSAPELDVTYYASATESFEIKGGYSASWQDTQAVTVDSQVAGSLVVDIVDVSTNQLVWRATASGTIDRNPKKNRKAILEAVSKMFADFPPPKP